MQSSTALMKVGFTLHYVGSGEEFWTSINKFKQIYYNYLFEKEAALYTLKADQ